MDVKKLTSYSYQYYVKAGKKKIFKNCFEKKYIFLFLFVFVINSFNFLYKIFLLFHKISKVLKLIPFDTDTDSNANNVRVYVETHNSSVMTWNTSDYCTPTSAPGIEEYHVIVRKG